MTFADYMNIMLALGEVIAFFASIIVWYIFGIKRNEKFLAMSAILVMFLLGIVGGFTIPLIMIIGIIISCAHALDLTINKIKEKI